MVSQPPAADTRTRIVAAAAHAFAARGFDGAKVDAIAARARVNKAMLYYHFRSKAALYRAILVDMFSGVAAAVAHVRDEPAAPPAAMRRFIEAVVAEAAARPHFPAMWLRELAEGGRHIDEDIVRPIRRVLATLTDIVQDGVRAGVFAPAHPFVIQIGIIAPILFFVASKPIRDRYAHLVPDAAVQPTIDDVVDHVFRSTLAVLTPPARPVRPAPQRRRRR
jgi:TetR/AcrR family transcriptional regulator